MIRGLRWRAAGLTGLLLLSSVSAMAALGLREFQPDRPISRAGRAAPVTAVVVNDGASDAEATIRLTVPAGVRVTEGAVVRTLRPASDDGEMPVTWTLEADAPGEVDVRVEVESPDGPPVSRTLRMRFEAPVAMRKLAYVPEPVPAPTEILVGAHHCPLWEPDQANLWINVLKHPERTPALGFYSQDNPEVSDWETKWAVEHGISFFVYCWYRDGQGGPVKMRFGSAIHDALFKARFADRLKFTIMWENQVRGRAGVADEHDLMVNLLPFWMENYFRNPGYLKVDNKPVLFIYRPEFLVDDLGGVTNVVRAFDRMRQACRGAGFDGLHILGEYRGLDARHLEHMKALGLDASFAYCWPVPGSPPPAQAVESQLGSIRRTQELGILPQVVTVSQAWSGWRDEGSIWKIPPAEFEGLLRQARDFVAALPKEQLGARMLLLDNWNEWGEGHYLAPYREHGFGYLDAVRRVFSSAPAAHEDLLPEDIGLGPYDTAVRGHFAREAELRRERTRRIVRPGAPDGLSGWWTFDEDDKARVAWDVSGHRRGGILRGAKRAPGREGGALVCDGGCVEVPGAADLGATNGLTVGCHVRTDAPAQENRWIINCVHGADPAAGFRLGVLNGRPCFQVPLTPWSHHLTSSEPLPAGRWVHLAGTFDGATMRLYVDGVERGTMERSGPLRAAAGPLILGNYAVGHGSHFEGLLDDVRVHGRVLAPGELRGESGR